jgi:glycosyltransferase involved in cell wall biosynthesis
MLIGASGPPVHYFEPWFSGYDDRLRALTARTRHVAYFCEVPHPHTFRYRVFNMVQALDVQPDCDISAAWFTRADLDQSLSFVERADVLVISRARYDIMVGRMIARARSRNVPVLFDVDDLIFDPDYAHLIADIIGRDLSESALCDWWFGEIARLGATLRLCDGAITTNTFLAGRITAFAPWITPRIVPNFLNGMQQAVSRCIYERKCTSGFARDGRVHIGYFSGTRSHNKDFAIAADGVARLMAADRRIVLRVVGLLDLPGAFAAFRERVETLPLQDFLNLQRLQGEVEICLAPVQDTVFTQCKSELKYFEAAATGTITIASPTFTFVRAIREFDNGFLARAHEWQDRIGCLIALLDDDPSAYEAMAERAAFDAETRYGVSRQASAISAALFGDASELDFPHFGRPNAEAGRPDLAKRTEL